METIPALGQMTIFDIPKEQNKRRPCEYSFQRYIGQRVRLTTSGVHGKITKIEAYYTHILTDKGELLVGTPTTTAPEGEQHEKNRDNALVGQR